MASFQSLPNLPPPRKGEEVGRWRLRNRLGWGGNGEVWDAVDEQGAEVAIKLLNKLKPIAYARFRDEVTALRLAAEIDGILPILYANLPETLPLSTRPWYAMPVASPLVNRVDISARRKVELIAEAAETLARLHAKEIFHRDIKPDNLLVYEGRCHVGDFGLVEYPDKTDVTGANEQLGPRWTMAPEVRRYGTAAEPGPADVYSLAKTLWIVLTGTGMGFDGRYDSRSADLSIRRHCGEIYITSLEQLLTACTEDSPDRRPSMEDVSFRLREWLRVSDSFPEHNPLEWAEIQQRLFPLQTPARAVWTSIDRIVSVLNILGETSNLNHMLFPDGGGLDLVGAAQSTREPGCIELIGRSSCTTLIRPKSLSFDSFDHDPQWNYFRIEAGELEPSGVYSNYDHHSFSYEELTDVGGQVYAARSCWDDNEHADKRLPPLSRVVMRYFKGGAFVLFQKTSLYNMNTSTYDGRHNRMTSDEFRSYIDQVVEYSISKDSDSVKGPRGHPPQRRLGLKRGSASTIARPR